MTLFETIISIGILSIIVCLGLVAWILKQGIIEPKRETEKQQKRIIQTEVEKAKIELNLHTVQTRMKPKVQESDTDDSLEKLRELRRR